MPLLDAAIAFSLTMLAVATAVSVLIEIGQSLASRRRKGLKEFLYRFYEEELAPAVASGVARAELQLNKSIAAGVDAALATVKSSLDSVATKADGKKFGENGHLPPRAKPAPNDGKTQLPAAGEVDTYALVEVSTPEMIDRLKQSELGRKLRDEAGHQAELVFDAIAERYERFGEVFSARFRRNRQVAAMIISLVLAFGINIDAIHLMQAYMLSDAARDAIISQAPQILAASKAASDADTQLKAKAEAALDRISALEASPLPIGWQQFPGCGPGSSDPRCRTEPGQTNASGRTPGGYISWAFGCILAGLLSGLGAPFWYKAATSLTSLADKYRPSANKPTPHKPKPNEQPEADAPAPA